MGMTGHEAIGIDLDTVAFFKSEQEIVIEAFGPIGFKQPIFVVALPYMDPSGMQGFIIDLREWVAAIYPAFQ